MPVTGRPEEKIEAYLGKLRGGLRGMNEAEVQEIVAELRSHILDRASAGEVSGQLTPTSVDDALAALGSPEELANQYLTTDLLARAEKSRSPVHILESLFRWASLSLAGVFVLLGTVVGYFFGIVLMLVAAAKIFHPHTAGLWVIPTGAYDFEISFRLGFGSAPAGGKDVLGWWIVPAGWVVGCGLVTLTTHVALWFVRLYRKSLIRKSLILKSMILP
jgi:uncharacterized membrane protein